jgi:integrase
MLFRLAEADKCDLPGSMLFFGRNDKIARTRIHYTLAAVDHLETAYRNCVNSLLDNVGRPGRFILDEVVNSGSYLGTPFCPKPGTVRKLARELQSAVGSTRRSTLADRHNLYALYTSMLISFGTGFRAIHDPSLKEIEIDFDWGIGIISDKGNASYRSRYVYLAPVVLEQIKYYRQHLQVLYGQLGVINPSLFNMVKTLDYEGLPLNLFWLRGDLDPVELLTPGVARMILARDHQYTIRLNAGRHYLKYRLIQRGCSPELVEAQLGHWENGQEPWGLYSNLDLLDFAGQMAGHLPKIMEEDGWQAIRGLG